MCNSPACNHNDLDDDISDIFGLAAVDASSVAAPARKVDATLADAQQMKMLTTEICKACRGTGRFTSWSGRTVGDCFKCKGTGKLTFRTTTAEREKAAVTRAKAAVRKAASIAEQAAEWALANAEDAAWIKAKTGSFDFATAMAEALAKYGSLTERQHATVTRLRLADAERNAVRKVEAETRAASAPVVTVARIEEAFAAARQNGVQRPKTYLGDFKFSMAPASGRNAGSLYVTRTSDDAYLGKVSDGRFFRVRECDAATESAIVAVASDPKEAAIAFGRRTGRCSCCGRELTNHASIDLGIGPICAEKYGW
jgi:hypothetical protein